MESEKNRTQAEHADLRASEEEALRSRVVEIIGGVGPRTRRSLEEPAKEVEEEEGDDSVFYEDDGQASRPAEEDARPRVCDARKRREERLVESEGVEAPGLEEMDAVASATQMEHPQETPRDMMKKPLEEHQDVQPSPASEDFKDPRGGFPEHKNTLETFSVRKGDEEEEEEEEEERGSVSEERRAGAAKPAGEEDNLSQQMSTDELQISRGNPEKLDQLEQQDHSSQGSTGRPQEPNPGYSTLPLAKKLGRGVSPTQAPVDPEASTRYNTISYRKIQRGNTRQKIKEFEFMVMNL